MNEWNIFVILFNTANIFFVLAFMAKKIVWLRLLTITGMAVSIPYYLYFQEAPLWNNFFWELVGPIIIRTISHHNR